MDHVKSTVAFGPCVLRRQSLRDAGHIGLIHREDNDSTRGEVGAKFRQGRLSHGSIDSLGGVLCVQKGLPAGCLPELKQQRGCYVERFGHLREVFRGLG
jgi:hypothetical protein